MADLVERLRKFIATKGMMLPASDFEMLALVANELDRIAALEAAVYEHKTAADAFEACWKDAKAALEAEASKGERRGLEREKVAKAIFDARPHNNPGRDGALRVPEWDRQSDATKAAFYRDAEAAVRALIPEAPVREGWLAIETAPKDGARVLAYRADQGVFICRWTTMEEVVPKNRDGDPSEIYDEDFEGWFHLHWGWLENEEEPTHWRPLPAPPQGNREG